MFNLLWKILKSETGTLTFTPVKRFKPVAGVKRGIIDITFDGTYPAGGWVVAAADLGLTSKLWNLKLQSRGGIQISFDHANSKIIAYEASGDPIDSNELDTVVSRAEYVGF